MAIGTPTALGQNSTSTAATTLAITTTAAVPAGAMIFLEISNHNNVLPSSVTDSAGNTYTLVSAANGTTVAATLAYALNAAALASGSTITITWASGRNAAAAAYYVTGIATASAADQQATNTTGSSATPSVGPTSATTQADELVIGLFGYSNTHTFTPGSGYTALATVESTGTVRGTCGEYKIVSATGAQTANGTFNSSATFAGVLVTFKAATGGGSVALSASGTVAITGAASLSVSGSSGVALSASGTVAITGAANLSVSGGGSVALSASGTIAITGSAALSAGSLSVALSASGTVAITGAASLSVSGGGAGFTASGTIRITGAASLAVMAAGGWHWTRFKRPLIDRYLNITIAATGGLGYVGVSKDGVSYSWFSGPLLADGRTLTAVADEAAAKIAAITLPTNGVWALPTTTEARVFKLGHKSAGLAYRIDEFYPRRLVEADDIRAESIKAIHIAAGSITGDRLYATAIDGFVITGATIQTGASGARVVLSSAAFGGLIGYGAIDTYDPSTGTGTYQVLWSKADGKLYAGSGNVVLDTNGITLNGGGGRANAVTYVNSSIQTIGELRAIEVPSFAMTTILSQRGVAPGTQARIDLVGANTGSYITLNANGAQLALIGFVGSSTSFLISTAYVKVENGLKVGVNAPDPAPGTIRLSSNLGSGTSTTRPAQIALHSDSNTNIKAEIGIDTALKILVIGMVEEGTAYRDIVLANNGGNVGIGSTAPTEKLAVLGNINLSGVYKVGGTQVLGTRKTGWGAPTGTLNRAALTNASTQAQFNQALMALITDLVSHGAIGA